MLEDKVLNEWIPDLQRKFQDFMPPIDKEYPRIYFTDDENFDEVMAKIEKEIDFSAHVVFSYTFAELIPGNLCDAILIHTEQLTEELYSDFAISFWRQLTYFYMANTIYQEWLDLYSMVEDEWDLYCEENMEAEGLDKKFQIRYGCRVWLPYVTSTIAQILLQKYSLPDVDYSEEQYLQAILNRDYISEEDIGEYFALILTNTVDENTLFVPSGIRDFLNSLKKILGAQSSQESFWIIDDKTLREIGAAYLDFKAYLVINHLRESIGLVENQYKHEHVEPIAPSADELKKKQKAKRKAQKQARKNNRRKK